jgi:simple sugar transport system substrate-binding protein
MKVKVTFAVVAILGVVCMLLLSACGSSSSSSSEASSTAASSEGSESTESSESSGEPVKVGLILGEPTAYYGEMEAGAKRAAEKMGIELSILTGKSDTEVQDQINKINDTVTSGVDAIAVTPDGPGVQPALEQAVSQGIPVVLLDSTLPEFKEQTAYVGTPNAEGGEIVGKYLVEQLHGKGKIGVLEGEANLISVAERVEGFEKELEGTEIEIVSALPTDCAAAKGYPTTQDMLTSHPEVEAIYAACGYPSVGAVKALEQAGHEIGTGPGKTLLVSYDICGPMAQLTAEGKIVAGVVQRNDLMGEKGVEVAAQASEGQNPPSKFVSTGVEFVTKSNASKYVNFC